MTFPSWGRAAHVEATLANGRTVALGARAARRRARLHVLSARSGYRVTLRGAETVRLVDVAPQSSQPDPGPSVAVRLARARLTARIIVDRTD